MKLTWRSCSIETSGGMTRKLQARSLLAINIAILQACTSMNLGDFCNGAGFKEAEPASLGVVLGAPAGRIVESPFIVFNTPSQAQPDATLQFNLEPAPLLWPASLDESPCNGLDWRTYEVAVDPVQWNAFWALPRPMPVSVGVGFWEYVIPLRASEFGFAIIDKASAEVLMSCGCYQT